MISYSSFEHFYTTLQLDTSAVQIIIHVPESLQSELCFFRLTIGWTFFHFLGRGGTNVFVTDVLCSRTFWWLKCTLSTLCTAPGAPVRALCQYSLLSKQLAQLQGHNQFTLTISTTNGINLFSTSLWTTQSLRRESFLTHTFYTNFFLKKAWPIWTHDVGTM